MNGKILHSPIRPTKTIQAHHIRHLISGTLVFLLGIAANEALMYLRRHSPRRVRWTATEMQTDYALPNALPPTHVQVDMGIAEDGTVVWRVRNESGPVAP